MDRLWRWATDFHSAHPLWAWLLPILVGGPLTLYWNRSFLHLDRSIRVRLGWRVPDDIAQPPIRWHGTEIVRVWSMKALRGAHVVAAGTQVAVVDRGVVQFKLAAGSPLPGRLPELERKHALTATAQALQFPAAIVDLSHTLVHVASASGAPPVDVIIKLHVGVNQERPQRVVESAPLRDGVISVAEVQALLEEAVRPWLQGMADRLDAASAAPLTHEMDAFLRVKFFEQYGLVGGVQAVSFHPSMA